MSWDLAGPAQIYQMGQTVYGRQGQAHRRFKGRPVEARVQAGAFPMLGGGGTIPRVLATVGAIGAIADIANPDIGFIRRSQPGPGVGNGAMQPQQVVPGTQYGVPFGGPGLKEPGGKYLLKEWHIRMDSKEGDFDLQFYLTINDRGTKRIFMYNQRTKAWKTWPMPRLAVIGKNLPRHQMLTRLRRNLKRHQADAVTILKLVAPGKLESTRRPGGRWVKGRKRYID